MVIILHDRVVIQSELDLRRQPHFGKTFSGKSSHMCSYFFFLQAIVMSKILNTAVNDKSTVSLDLSVINIK